jgi:ABC-2 type transport system ATP-binding protein
VEFDNNVSAAQLKKIPNASKVEALNNGWLIESLSNTDLRKEVAQFAQAQDWLILTLNIEQKTLEEVFKELTK